MAPRGKPRVRVVHIHNYLRTKVLRYQESLASIEIKCRVTCMDSFTDEEYDRLTLELFAVQSQMTTDEVQEVHSEVHRMVLEGTVIELWRRGELICRGFNDEGELTWDKPLDPSLN